MVDIYLLTTEIVLAVTAVTELFLHILDRIEKSDRHRKPHKH